MSSPRPQGPATIRSFPRWRRRWRPTSRTVTDFSSVDDTINLLQTLVAKAGGPGPLSAGEFVSMADLVATDPHHIIYNTTTGGLYYNADGAGVGAPVLIATFQGSPTISHTDIVLA